MLISSFGKLALPVAATGLHPDIVVAAMPLSATFNITYAGGFLRRCINQTMIFAIDC